MKNHLVHIVCQWSQILTSKVVEDCKISSVDLIGSYRFLGHVPQWNSRPDARIIGAACEGQAG